MNCPRTGFCVKVWNTRLISARIGRCWLEASIAAKTWLCHVAAFLNLVPKQSFSERSERLLDDCVAGCGFTVGILSYSD